MAWTRSHAAACRRAGRRSSAAGLDPARRLLALTFLVNGALHFDEPGVLMTFEENEEEIASDVASLGFDLPELVKAQTFAVDYVRVERSEIEETGEYDLEGLFVRLDYAIGRWAPDGSSSIPSNRCLRG